MSDEVKPDERGWFHEIGFMGPGSLNSIELVQAAGCEHVYGFATFDPERNRPGQPVELERAESRALAAERDVGAMKAVFTQITQGFVDDGDDVTGPHLAEVDVWLAYQDLRARCALAETFIPEDRREEFRAALADQESDG